ncbi:MAG: hypothetical protein RR034_01025 [Bacteroidales bacterium]
MSNKIVKIIVFTVAIVTCLTTIWFGVGFKQDKVTSYEENFIIKENNPEVLVAFRAVTPENLSAFVEKYQKDASTLSSELKENQLQKDILYTYIFQLKDLTETTFSEYQQNFDKYSKVLFAKSNNAQKYIDGFKSVADFTALAGYIKQLDAEYSIIKQDYLQKKQYVKSFNALVTRAELVNSTVSETKKAEELKTLQEDSKNFSSESSVLNITILLCYILMIAAIVLILIFATINIIANIKTSYKTIFVLIGFAIIVGIGYFISSPEVIPSALKMQLTAGDIKWVGAGLFTFYIVFFAAILSIIATVIISAIKNRK